MLVIFDCDGVLVDSERLGSEAFSRCLFEVGIEFSAEQCLSQFKGWTDERSYYWLEQKFNKTLPNNFDRMYCDYLKEFFKGRLRAIDGVEQVIQSLIERSIPYCMASNGPHEKVGFSLEVTGLDRYFPHTHRFSSDDVSEGKPSPELFLHAAESVGVPPQFCWVIEDSLSGCSAADRAGMRFVYFQHEKQPVEDIIKLSPGAVCTSMPDVNAFFNVR